MLWSNVVYFCKMPLKGNCGGTCLMAVILMMHDDDYQALMIVNGDDYDDQ